MEKNPTLAQTARMGHPQIPNQSLGHPPDDTEGRGTRKFQVKGWATRPTATPTPGRVAQPLVSFKVRITDGEYHR